MKYMFKSGSKIFIVALMLTILLSSAFLFSCRKNVDIPVVVEAGDNGKIEKIEEDNDEFYIATPNDWHMFVGWFDGYRKYSENPRLKITQNTPKKLEARFTTTGTLSFDRIFNSLYNSYVKGIAEEGDYFNFLGEGTLKFNNLQTNINLGGALNFLGNGNQIYFKGEGDNNFSYIYNDNFENGYFYIENNDEKIAFENLGLLSNILIKLPDPSLNAWNVENIIKNDRLYYQFDQYFGYLNAFGIIKSVSNTSNQTELTITFNKLLSLLKNYYTMFEDGSIGRKIIDVLIGAYDDDNYPKITISIKVNYKEGQKEQIENLEIDCNLEKDYHLNLGNEGLIIPKGNINFKLNNLIYGFSDKANKIDSDELESYPMSSKNMLNAHIDGKMLFKVEGEENYIMDEYKVEFDSDINPFALLAFKRNPQNIYDVEWEKLGFLSFRVVLVPFKDEDMALEQYYRHKGSTDYINVLIDTKRFGPKVFVYASCYNPSTLFSTTYLINNSYDLHALLSFDNQEDTANRAKQDENGILKNISNLVKSLLNLTIKFDENNLNKSFYEFLSSFMSEEFNSNIILEEDKISVDISSIRNIIREMERKNGLTLAGNPIKTDKYLFGEEPINKIELSFDSFSKNSVVKDDLNNYLDINGKDIVKEFNNKHSLVVDISSIGEVENLSLTELLALKDKSIQANELILSDGTKSDKYVDCDGNTVNLSLTVQNVKVGEEIDGKVEVKLILFVNSPTHTVITLTNSISNILYEYFKIPFGLFEYSFYVDID